MVVSIELWSIALGAAGAERGSGEARRLDSAGCFRKPLAGVDAIEPADADRVSGRVRGWYEVCSAAETVTAFRRGIGGTAGASSSSLVCWILTTQIQKPKAQLAEMSLGHEH